MLYARLPDTKGPTPQNVSGLLTDIQPSVAFFIELHQELERHNEGDSQANIHELLKKLLGKDQLPDVLASFQSLVKQRQTEGKGYRQLYIPAETLEQSALRTQETFDALELCLQKGHHLQLPKPYILGFQTHIKNARTLIHALAAWSKTLHVESARSFQAMKDRAPQIPPKKQEPVPVTKPWWQFWK